MADDVAAAAAAVADDMNGWQYGKSLQQCNRFLLDNQVATDVTFEVLRADDSGTFCELKAHRSILIARSRAFESMIVEATKERSRKKIVESDDVTGAESKGRKGDGGMDGGAQLKIRKLLDVKADVFKEVLSFVYTDDAKISPLIALPLKKAANQFLLPALAEKCQKFIEENLTVENVCIILDQSLNQGEMELKDRCVNFIGVNANAVTKSTAFLALSYEALDIIIGSDWLDMNECDVHRACIAWARYQLQNNDHVRNPSDEQILKKLHEILYRIRYPILDHGTFAGLVQTSDLPPDVEKANIYYYITTKTKTPKLKFDCHPRGVLSVVERYATVTAGPWNQDQFNADAIQFTIDKDIVLSAVGVYVGYLGFDYSVTIYLQVGADTISKTTTNVHVAGGAQTVKVALSQPVELKAATAYVMWAPSIKQTYGFYGQGGKNVVPVNGVTFTFSNVTTLSMSSGTNLTQGQFPQLYFSHDPMKADHVVERYLGIENKTWDCGPGKDAIQFTVDRDILLSAIGLYAGAANVDYDVTVNIQHNGSVISTIVSKVHADGATPKVKVALAKPLEIKAGEAYVIWTTPVAQSVGFYGKAGRRTVHEKGVSFAFEDFPALQSRTTTAEGQLPQLFFDVLPIKLSARAERVVERYDVINDVAWHATVGQDAVQFSVSKDVVVTAVGVFAGQTGADYNITINVLLNNVNISATTATVHAVDQDKTVKVNLVKALDIKAGTKYTVVTPSVPDVRYGHHGSCGRRQRTVNDVTFSFFNSAQPNNRTTIATGQLPQLYFMDFE